MLDLHSLLNLTAARHRDHLCPRQVLGVRMGLYAAELFHLDLPQTDKRLFAFVETDGCMTDGIAVATGCWWGSRTMRLIDYGKTAATFVDSYSEEAIRVTPSRISRTRAAYYAPHAPDRWHAQLEAYQVMPAAELLDAQPVRLTLDLAAVISWHGVRVVCQRCGEDIINARYVEREGQRLCHACAEGAYFADIGSELSEVSMVAAMGSV